MRTLKLLLVAVLMTTGTMALANPTSNPGKTGKSVSYEIEKMLHKSDLVIEDDFMVTVRFTISESNEILIRSIKSENEEVAQFIMERLNHRKVSGKSWDQDKLYELPVKVQAKR